MGERLEILMRIVVGIISGLILCVWGTLVKLFVIAQLIYVLVKGKRNKTLADFCQDWNSYYYKFLKYMTFATNERVFPFSYWKKPIESADMNPPKGRK